MKIYPIPMVPGPVYVPDAVREAYSAQYGSADLESEFLDLYDQTEQDLQALMGTQNSMVIHSGEGMIALWGALKSCIRPGEKVLALGTGVFGYGIGDMAAQIGADVRKIGTEYNETLHDFTAVEQAIVEFRPKMITAVHCETPSGTLNPLAEVGRLKEKHGVPLLYVDVVASVGGTPVQSDEWSIDLCLGGSQKALSAPPDMSFVAVSEAAWSIIEEVGYAGYDAFLPFRTARDNFYFPYTPSWHGMAGLQAAASAILAEGLENVYTRHEKVAVYCRERLQECDVELFPAAEAIPAPTVTAARVPAAFTWAEFDRALRDKGLVVGGSYGPLTGKVFRIGHMGSQADWELIQQAMDVIQQVLEHR